MPLRQLPRSLAIFFYCTLRLVEVEQGGGVEQCFVGRAASITLDRLGRGQADDVARSRFEGYDRRDRARKAQRRGGGGLKMKAFSLLHT